MTQATAPAQNGNQSKGLQLRTDPRSLSFKHLFESDGFQRSLRQTLPRHLDPQRLIRVTLAALTQTPALLSCSPESVMLSLMRAAAMGLEPDGGPLGQGYLVPFGKECQFIPGYRGLVKLARNSGEIADVSAEVVYQADSFEYELGLNPTLRHKRNDDADDPGPLRYAYAVARFRDGERKFVVLNKREVERIKGVSKSAGSSHSPWNQWPAEMWKKSAVRRLCKLLPLSVEMAHALTDDDNADSAFGSGSTIEIPSLPELPRIESTPEAEAPAETSPENAAEPSGGLDWSAVENDFGAAETLGQIGETLASWSQGTSEDEGKKLSLIADAHRQRIRSSRGSAAKVGA